VSVSSQLLFGSGVIPCEFALIHFCLLFIFHFSYFVISEFIFYFYFLGFLDMDRFIINKRKLDDDNESSVAGTSSGISHILVVQLVLVLKLSCANVMKTICPLD
jgi:hypothetical protein